MRLGDLIFRRMQEVKMTRAELGRQIFMSRQNVSLLLEKDSLSTDVLTRICFALDYDFYAHLAWGEAKELPPGPAAAQYVIELPDDPAVRMAMLVDLEVAYDRFWRDR